MIFEKNKFEICLNGVDPAWGGESRGLKMGSFSLKKKIFIRPQKFFKCSCTSLIRFKPQCHGCQEGSWVRKIIGHEWKSSFS
jgi:hypothetical protein